MKCKECERLKEGIYSIVASLVNGEQEVALRLARTVMYGGSVNNALDCADPTRHLSSTLSGVWG